MMFFFQLLIGFERLYIGCVILVYLGVHVLLPNEYSGKVQLLCEPHPPFKIKGSRLVSPQIDVEAFPVVPCRLRPFQMPRSGITSLDETTGPDHLSRSQT